MVGPRSYRIEFTEGMKRRIQDMAKDGFTYADIAKRFNISTVVVGKIVRGEK